MSYSHLLVSVAVSPESHQLVARAVSIARPNNARISLITLAAEPEMYNQLAAPMLEDIREVLQEETQQFLRELVERAKYPVHQTVIATGELMFLIFFRHDGRKSKTAVRKNTLKR